MTRKVKKSALKNDYVTKSHFDLAMKQVDKRFDKVGADISNIKYDVKEMKEDMGTLKEGQEKMMIMLDGYIKQNEDFKEEFYIMKGEIRVIKKVIKEKLGVEIKAMG